MRFGILVVLVLALAPAARAQDTGGSFGGSHWGGSSSGGSSGGSSGSSSSWGRSYGSSSGSYGSSSSSGGTPSFGKAMGQALCGFITVFGIPFAIMGINAIRNGRGGKRGPAGRRWSKVDVTAIRLAIDWRARAAVQRRLDALARSGATGSASGLVRLLRETAGLLDSVKVSWLYADVSNYHPMSQAMAQGTFDQLAVDARSRFRREVVRNADGRIETADAGVQTPKAHEGEGVVVVTVIVAARRELRDVPRGADAMEVGALIADLSKLYERDLVALEVIWSPAAEGDRMSTAELVALYPSLQRMDEQTVGGRVFCDHCRAPYAHELPRCPHCGAPSSRAA